MEIISINTEADKPRKGSKLLQTGNGRATSLDWELSSADFIASFKVKPLGLVLLGVFNEESKGVLIELRVNEQEDRPGYVDRKTKISVFTTEDSSPIYSALNGLNTKFLTVAYKSDVLSIYYFGKTVGLEMSDFNPARISITVGFPLQLEEYGFFTHYDPDSPFFETIPSIQLDWRKWLKDQCELTTGYANFTKSLKSYNRINDLLGSTSYWDEVGLHIEEPVPEDFC